MKYETLTVGQIVADKYEAANVFEKYGIDYCCHGSTPLLEACKNANVELDQVQKELENTIIVCLRKHRFYQLAYRFTHRLYSQNPPPQHSLARARIITSLGQSL